MDFPRDGIGSRDRESGQDGFKFAARSVAAILGTLVLDQGDAAGVLAVDDRAHFVPPRSGHHHLRVFLAELAQLAPAAPRDRDALRRAATLLKRRGLVIAVSDFYEDEAAVAQLRRLARMGHDVIAIICCAGRAVAGRRRGRGVRRSRNGPQAGERRREPAAALEESTNSAAPPTSRVTSSRESLCRTITSVPHPRQPPQLLQHRSS